MLRNLGALRGILLSHGVRLEKFLIEAADNFDAYLLGFVDIHAGVYCCQVLLKTAVRDRPYNSRAAARLLAPARNPVRVGADVVHHGIFNLGHLRAIERPGISTHRDKQTYQHRSYYSSHTCHTTLVHMRLTSI